MCLSILRGTLVYTRVWCPRSTLGSAARYKKECPAFAYPSTVQLSPLPLFLYCSCGTLNYYRAWVSENLALVRNSAYYSRTLTGQHAEGDMREPTVTLRGTPCTQTHAYMYCVCCTRAHSRQHRQTQGGLFFCMHILNVHTLTRFAGGVGTWYIHRLLLTGVFRKYGRIDRYRWICI